MTTAFGRRVACGWLAGCALAGCATRPPASPDSPWTSGRLVIRIAAHQDQPARGMSASFDLRGNAEQGELRLLTPLGTLLAQARWAPGMASLTTPDGSQRFDDLDALAREALGEALPLRALPDWLAARPWPGAASRTVDDGFEQLGWRVRVSAFGEGLIEAQRDAPPSVSLRARMER